MDEARRRAKIERLRKEADAKYEEWRQASEKLGLAKLALLRDLGKQDQRRKLGK